MAGGFHPLRRGTIMMFGSLEFMSLGSGYDMVLLPPRNDVEPSPEPIPPQSVRGRRSGHHAGGSRGGVRDLGSPTLPLRLGPVRPSPRIFLTRSPVPPARQALEEGLAGHQTPVPGPAEDHRGLPFHPGQRGRHGPRPSPARGTKGPQRPVLLRLRTKEQQRHLLSYLLGSGMPPPPTPLP